MQAGVDALITPIRYRKGLKYQLAETYSIKLSFAPSCDIKTEWIEFYTTGWLVIKAGYAWDGPSGPTYDDHTNMRGSLVHDALYQLMRLGLLGETYRIHADKAFRRICLEDGMSAIRAALYFDGVHLFGAQYAERQEERICTAP